ncbi:hypothetical protein D3C81_1217820 [compost metagenome]
MIVHWHYLTLVSDAVHHAFRFGGGRNEVQSHHAAGCLASLGDQRPPLEDLFNVLQADDPGLLLASPLQSDPRQVPNLTLARLAASGLAVVRAVWRHVEPANGLAAAFGVRITIEHVSGVMHCARVIDGVHADRLRAVVLRDIHSTTQAHFQAGTGAATTAEEVDNDLIVLSAEAEPVLGFEVELVFFERRHAASSVGSWPSSMAWRFMSSSKASRSASRRWA